MLELTYKQTSIIVIFQSYCRLSITSFIFLLLTTLSSAVFAADEDNAFGITNFAFASYLGTGFYSTSGQNVFVVQLPFEHVIIEKTDTEAGWVLNLPLTFGFLNFDELNLPGIAAQASNIPEVNDVGTITFLPGIEYQYPVTKDWTFIPFADYGFARELNKHINTLIIGVGVKNYIDFQFENSLLTFGNTLLYAREKSSVSANKTDYSLVETGLNLRLKTDMIFDDERLYTNLYYINFYYPNNLVFFERSLEPIKVGVEHEIGITFSNIPDFLFFEKPQIGFGVRVGNDVNVYRLVFGMPF